MFKSTVTRKIQTSLAVAVLLGTSLTAQADVLSTSELVSAIEQNITAQTQEMMASAKRDFMLSVQTQLAESMFEYDELTNVDDEESESQIAKVEE